LLHLFFCCKIVGTFSFLFFDKKKLMSLLNFYSKENKVVTDFIYESLKKRIEEIDDDEDEDGGLIVRK